MNPLSAKLTTGTVGELIVQLRLLQFDVQAVSTHKDTGNDLLATRGETFRAFQVKATRSTDREITFNCRRALARRFHILALVFLSGEDDRLDVDRCTVFLLARTDVTKGCYQHDELAAYEMTRARVDDLFSRELRAS